MEKINLQKNDLISKLSFKGIWRPYQKRVLNELDYHLEDKKLNVVAAPGAGKTTLGIEVLIRLGRPALILSPTIIIKNQWKQRIVEGFLPENEPKEWISDDIKNVSTITTTTYQALHTIYKNKEEKEKFIQSLKQYNIQTLVLDEAHHLRTEWYVTLKELCDELDGLNFTTVALTGTPPYDVSPEEWSNYHSLCGPVDAEISIPELVKNGNLCPHQDLIYFSNLTNEEEKTIYDFEEKREQFFEFMQKSSDFLYAIEGSRFITEYEKNTDIIYKHVNFTIAVISYLLSTDELNMTARVLADFLQLDVVQIQKFDYHTAEILINGMLGEYEEFFKNIPIIRNKLKELKLLKGKKVDFSGETDFKNIFARSKNKLNAINEITNVEFKNLKNDLREVILLDYIGSENNIGLDIFSVFNTLSDKNIPLGILTGNIVVIPEKAKSELYKILNEKNISFNKVLTTEFEKGYLRVETFGAINIVEIITELFQRGVINILIGTAALLGEGWDSPCVNTLIIASIVGSFMLSNQMRGRALRIDKNKPDKTANIWHLVSLSSDSIAKNLDLYVVDKRFNTFEGISYKDNKIQNGIKRLYVDWAMLSVNNCLKENEKAFIHATNRQVIAEKWKQVFLKSQITEDNMTSQVFEVVNTKLNLPEIPNENKKSLLERMFGSSKIQKIQTSLKEQKIVAECILKTLCDIGQIKTPYEQIELKQIKDDKENYYLTILNCMGNERNIFIKSYAEVFRFTGDERYILKIVIGQKPLNFFSRQTKFSKKYLAVPEIIGLNKKNVAIFAKYLKIALLNLKEYNLRILGIPVNYMLKKIERIDIIYTKYVEGKQELLEAQYNAFLTSDVSKSRVWI